MTITAIDGTQLSLASFYALSCAFNSNALYFCILFSPLAKDVLWRGKILSVFPLNLLIFLLSFSTVWFFQGHDWNGSSCEIIVIHHWHVLIHLFLHTTLVQGTDICQLVVFSVAGRFFICLFFTHPSVSSRTRCLFSFISKLKINLWGLNIKVKRIFFLTINTVKAQFSLWCIWYESQWALCWLLVVSYRSTTGITFWPLSLSLISKGPRRGFHCVTMCVFVNG